MTIFSRTKEILRSFDPIIKDTLRDEMTSIGIDIVPNSAVTSLSKADDKAITLSYTSNNNAATAEYDTVLWAVGREPLLEKLAIDKAGVTTNKKGYVVADEYQETVIPGVYALGDVCGIEQLTPGMSLIYSGNMGDFVHDIDVRIYNTHEGEYVLL